MPVDKRISELTAATAINPSDVSILVHDGTDYQYPFTLLLQFLSANLAIGAVLSFGTDLPGSPDGKDGDVFIKTDSGQFAQKLSGTWTVVYTIPSGNAADGTML